MSLRCAHPLAFLCLLAAAGFARAEDSPRDEPSLVEAFKAARPKIAHDLRERDTAARLAAIHKLAEFPVVDSAKLLVPALANTEVAIRQASFESLAGMTSAASVAEYLHQQATRHWKQPKPTAETLGVVAALLAAESPERQQAASELVAAAANHSDAGRTVAIDLIDQLGTGGGEPACRALVQLLAIPRTETDFAFHRAIEQALVRLRTKSAVSALVKMLAAARGEVQADIISFLTQISGESLGTDADHWAAWWQDKQATFEFPPLPVTPARPLAPPLANVPSYYDLPITASRIVFIIDASGSMLGPRFTAAKRELAKAVEALPPSTAFNIVAFHTRASVWQPKLQLATDDNKRNALYFLAAQSLGSKTASYDALEAALQLDAEAIYFLTDGAPTAGKIVHPPQIVAAISRQNRYRRLTIHALGIGINSSSFESFLQSLAAQNYGRFERIDQ